LNHGGAGEKDRVKILGILWIFGLLLVMLALYGLTLPLGWAAERENQSVFSLDVNNEPLDDVLHRISKASGYEITVNEGWRGKTVSARLENVTLEEALKAIMEELGRPSYLLVYDKEKKRIEIVLVPASSLTPESARKVEPSAPLRRQQQALPPTLERGNPVTRPSPRRIRERTPGPTASPQKTLDHTGPAKGGADSVSENRRPPDTEPELGEPPAESPDSPEREDVTPETRLEMKAMPQRRGIAPESPEGKPESSGP
jgi:hypothetical protein